MKNILRISCIFLVLFGCSKKNNGIELFGSNIPANGITKDLPKVSREKNISSKAVSVEYQKHLDTLLENELVKVDSLQLFQNGDSYLPLRRMIEKSKKYFYMNVLSFSCDETTEKMVQLLEAKARSGVDVRLIVNKGFSYLSSACLGRLKDSGVRLVKAKTHSSYFLNDQAELMIGSQSVARMFFLSDGFNSLDRDMMIYSKGALATDAFRDFISSWIQEGDSGPLEKHDADLSQYQELLKADYLQKTRGKALYTGTNIRPEMACRFISERPKLGVKDIQVLWQELTSINQKELFFSGVKVDTGTGALGEMIKEKSRNGVDTHYLGNGHDSGNGELTMVMNEWIASLKKGSFSFLSRILEKFKDWDKIRLALNNQKLYGSLKDKASINVWAYFNFIHYKVWLFDHPGFFIGSANLDQSKFGEVSDAGIYCLDSKIHNQLKVQLLRDRLNSVLYLPKNQVKNQVTK